MFYTVIYINLFQYFYNVIKKKSLTNLLMSNTLSNKLKNRILIVSYFSKISYSDNLLIKLKSDYDDYTLRQSITDKYTSATFKDGIMILDYDNEGITLSEIKKSLDLFPYTYDIVKSIGGYHVFVTSSFFNLKSVNTLKIMCSFRGADPLFIFFMFMRGTANIRMCKKENENPHEPIYKFIESYSSKSVKNNQNGPIARIHKIVINHIKEAEKYSNIIVKVKENSKTNLLERKFTELENEPGSLLDPKNKFAEVKYNVPNDISQDILKYIESRKDLYPVALSKHYVPYDYKK